MATDYDKRGYAKRDIRKTKVAVCVSRAFSRRIRTHQIVANIHRVMKKNGNVKRNNYMLLNEQEYLTEGKKEYKVNF